MSFALALTHPSPGASTAAAPTAPAPAHRIVGSSDPRCGDLAEEFAEHDTEIPVLNVIGTEERRPVRVGDRVRFGFGPSKYREGRVVRLTRARDSQLVAEVIEGTHNFEVERISTNRIVPQYSFICQELTEQRGDYEGQITFR